MILKMYAVRDLGARAFLAPFCATNDHDARRQFLMSSKHAPIMSEYPDDFDLYYVSNYDTDTGLVSPLGIPDCIQKGVRHDNQIQANPSS